MDKQSLKISDFDYNLPTELIAQTPLEPRDASRLLVVQRTSGTMEHRHFRDIGDYLRPGDLLVANQSRVIPARLLGKRAETGGAVEVLLLAERPDLGQDCWEALVRPGRRLREGAMILFNDERDAPRLQGEVMERTEAGGRVLRFSTYGNSEPTNAADPYSLLNVRQLIDELGRMPLPPYIHEKLNDPERYQTVYARIRGSAAAPTAGLHFTPQLLEQLRQQGVRVGFVTLHVGLDTFRPVECEDVSEHKMHSEEIDLDAPTAELIRETRAAGGRVVAVGTTTMRVLESVAGFHNGQIEPFHGHTSLFITPGFHFQAVDALITNFHLPRSTLLLLVSAFMGKGLMEKAYQEAIEQRYRFFSFGDAMLLL
ncbi:tRNA preQ1(34) S-adenosylmethionine ribosyltransferase-isomerase QueA [Ktedonosporobacter rubrisoli]|uniref:S-adenosylmethionine:tRNA ribosyltransferase-isomerase n=1 Tax=Ktedonosporobacter rubrisoli TaxID=2509675 RepID=A0A4P6JY84_KTERU|nr:tRNA preQ1(34) S-adenosylmethionine ribosyltransferase-isomerase QueA [Ktedonosporobacter rubrisoli]QBD80423.1 tRNA preQ1(34) S-adenosylmethionine ribosyltransferase-isomerase QueA [Ktedonosporobacter rubrisoli]